MSYIHRSSELTFRINHQRWLDVWLIQCLMLSSTGSQLQDNTVQVLVSSTRQLRVRGDLYVRSRGFRASQQRWKGPERRHRATGARLQENENVGWEEEENEEDQECGPRKICCLSVWNQSWAGIFQWIVQLPISHCAIGNLPKTTIKHVALAGPLFVLYWM